MSARNNPFEDLERLFERMNRRFEDPDGMRTPAQLGRESASGRMAVDLVDHGDEFVLTVDLPGFETADVDIRVTAHTLRIEAEREEATEEEAEQYLRQERRHESMRRSLRLPDEVDKGNVQAWMQNGVLTIRLPKAEAESTRSIEIE
jgi:HSP20 family protein